MLYAQWRQVARLCQTEIALHDLTSGQRWSFAELAALAEHSPPDTSPVAFPQGASAEFIIGVLKAWRSGQVVCPIEPDHSPPLITHPLPKQIVHLKTTSATTGAPRLAAFTAEQLIADSQNIISTMGLRPDWPNLGVISMAHSYGFSNLVLPLLLKGIPLILVGSALPEAVRRAAKLAPAITLAAVPALWRNWHEAKSIPPNIHLAISAGALLPVSLEQSIFAVQGLKIHNFYGSSECGGIAYDASTSPRSDLACVGAPLRNVNVSVAEDGCLEIRSAAVGQGYWPDPTPTFGNGVFRTSDLAEIARGLVYLRGRATDLINIAGRKVSPEVIENALTAHPKVLECLVFGVPLAETERGETIVACISVKSEISREELKQFLIPKLTPWQIPREWWFVESLCTNHRGKLSRPDWRKRYLDR